MMNNNHIILKDFLNNTFAVSTELGEDLFHLLKSKLDNNETVTLDFEGIIVLITAFLNSSVGPLYNNYYTNEFIDSNLKFVNISESNLKYINLVKENAKKYYKNQEQFDKNTDDTLNG